jgi:hypothetical protein
MANEYFDPTHDNRLARCVELELSEGQGTTQKSLTLLAEVRCGTGRLQSERFTATIGVSEVELVIEIEGGTVATQSRFGERIRAAEERIETTTVETDVTKIQTGASVGGNLDLNSGGRLPTGAIRASGSAAYNRDVKRKSDRKFTQAEITRRVQALGGNTWVLKEPGNALLDGTYLRDDALCRIEASTRINKVRGVVSVAKKHVKVLSVVNNETGGDVRIGPNRAKILQILAGQTLGTDGELIKLSESSLVSRDDD